MAGIYQVYLKEHLDTHWATRFDGFHISYREDGATLLTGPVPDQAALHGLLARIRDLGLTLLAVVCADCETKMSEFCSEPGYDELRGGVLERGVERGDDISQRIYRSNELLCEGSCDGSAGASKPNG